MCPRESGTGQDYHPSSAWCPVTQNVPTNQQPICVPPLMQAPCLSIHSGNMAALTVCARTTHSKHSSNSHCSPFLLCENKDYLLFFISSDLKNLDVLVKHYQDVKKGKVPYFQMKSVSPWRGSQTQSKSLLAADSLLSGVWERWKGVPFCLHGLTRQQTLKCRHAA